MSPTSRVSIRRLALGFIFFIVFVVGIPVFVGTWLWTRITELHKGYNTVEQFVDIPQGASAAEIRGRLVEAGIIRDDITARAALIWTREATRLKAGEYRFDRPISAVDVVHKLARGDVYTRRLTFPEGLTIEEMAGVFESHGFGEAKAFVEAAGDASLIRDLDPRAKDLEGYLFPETYTLSRQTTAHDVVAQMVDGFRRNTPDLVAKAQAQNLTVRQVITLASLVEKETAQATERPMVSAVYRNRLGKRMGMQADPTVVYALRKAGRYNGNIRRVDLQIDSPYNTYRYPGLPPGPIAAPGKASIDAALSPSAVDYLYFVSRNDGTHVFATTLAEHNANVYKHQVLYFQQQKQKQKAQSRR